MNTNIDFNNNLLNNVNAISNDTAGEVKLEATAGDPVATFKTAGVDVFKNIDLTDKRVC